MTTVFTNGCFDIIHAGHVDLLQRARALGTKLIVGINSDQSVREIKGPGRPYVSQQDRATVLLGLSCVDEVICFDELTPERLIAELKPDVLVKGGDWPIDQIVGADFVQKQGGKVFSLALIPGYSSSAIVSRIIGAQPGADVPAVPASTLVSASLAEHVEVLTALGQNCLGAIERCGAEIGQAFGRGAKLLLCGNGGSASDAQHIAAEFVGRFERQRVGLPAIALTTDTSALTAISNDYGFERIFSRQVEALAQPQDLLIAISTSGESANVIAAVMAARKLGCRTLALTGAGGKRLASLCDCAVLVPSLRTARIQEAHITIGHIWCEMADARFSTDAALAKMAEVAG